MIQIKTNSERTNSSNEKNIAVDSHCKSRLAAAGFVLCFGLLLTGCANVTEESSDTKLPEEIEEDSREETLSEIEEYNTSDDETTQDTDENIVWYMDLWAEELEPVMTAEELEQLGQIEWDENIRPYMEYNWISDERIERNDWASNLWVMQLADLNMDGQPEMLVSEYFYSLDDLTHVYTLKDGEVIYCGKIIASAAFEYNESYGGSSYLPSYYIDVYQNDEGEFRYLSSEEFARMEGHYQIYESSFDGTGISCEPVFAISYAHVSGGNTNYYYEIGDWHEKENETPDDENYTAFHQVMEEYMEGYEKVDIDFVVCEYRVPTLAGVLPEEQQEIVRNNIVFGFAQALGYVDK